MKRYFVEFEFKQKVRGYVIAKNQKQAIEKVKECQNPDFDEMQEYTQASEPEIDFFSCYPEE